MHGSLSIKNESVTWSKSDRDSYVAVAAIGMLAGIAVTYARMPLQLPGHKVLWWMVPVLAARLIRGPRAGASVGALTTAATTLSLGGRIAGGVVMTPMIVAAGVVLDLAAETADRRKWGIWRKLLLFAVAGMLGNLLCFIKRLFDPDGAFFSSANLLDLTQAATSYAVFGVGAGILGAVIGYGLLHLRRARNRGA